MSSPAGVWFSSIFTVYSSNLAMFSAVGCWGGSPHLSGCGLSFRQTCLRFLMVPSSWVLLCEWTLSAGCDDVALTVIRSMGAASEDWKVSCAFSAVLVIAVISLVSSFTSVRGRAVVTAMLGLLPLFTPSGLMLAELTLPALLFTVLPTLSYQPWIMSGSCSWLPAASVCFMMSAAAGPDVCINCQADIGIVETASSSTMLSGNTTLHST